MDTEILVLGAGHAGVEAALAAARLGARMTLVTLDAGAIGRMSCNPAVGGLAKGQLVREVDALGGEIGLATDATGIQFRMLNASKGPAVRSPRVQVDRRAYNEEMVRRVRACPGLEVLEDEVLALWTREARSDEEGRFVLLGAELASGRRLEAPRIVLTSGTFLGGCLHRGTEEVEGGRQGERAATRLSEGLRTLGLRLGRLKTGTPPRLDRESLDLDRLEPQPGDVRPQPMSFRSGTLDRPSLSCWLTRTTAATHALVAAHAHLSPMFQGRIVGSGPRYCPSIEDKVDRFADKESHQVFLEPEGVDAREVYPNGISTSLPDEVQERFVRTIPGLEQAVILQPGYAVEYDHLETDQLRADLSVAGVTGLYAAGQVNGTSGYEEAAAQGLVAGINAVLSLRGEAPFLPDRRQSYIGVLVDDLCRVNPREPYRMFTSRAEHRLYLRHGNADLRLSPIGHRLGLLPASQASRVEARRQLLSEAAALLISTRVAGKDLATLLRRPDTSLPDLFVHAPVLESLALSPEDIAELEAQVLYEPYLERQARDRQRLEKLQSLHMPGRLDYRSLRGLKTEAREILHARQPRTLAEARDLPGVTPADLSVLMVALRT